MLIMQRLHENDLVGELPHPEALPGNDDGFAAELRVIALLNRSIKRVHINMDDFAHELSGNVP